MKTKTFYRLANKETGSGLWYDMQGGFTGLIHDKFNFCKNCHLPMQYNSEISGWLSATEAIEELFEWFPKEDIAKLETHNYFITKYSASEYKHHENHWLIKQDSSEIKSFLKLSEVTV